MLRLAGSRLGLVMLSALASLVGLADGAAAASGAEQVSPAIYQLMVFVVAIFVGYYVVWSVTPALHTPLMAVTNAISSVIVVGGLIAAAAFSGDAGPNGWIAKGAGVAAVTLASVNIFGGFMVTRRMLAMYRKKEKPKAAEASKA